MLFGARGEIVPLSSEGRGWLGHFPEAQGWGYFRGGHSVSRHRLSACRARQHVGPLGHRGRVSSTSWAFSKELDVPGNGAACWEAGLKQHTGRGLTPLLQAEAKPAHWAAESRREAEHKSGHGQERRTGTISWVMLRVWEPIACEVWEEGRG